MSRQAVCVLFNSILSLDRVLRRHFDGVEAVEHIHVGQHHTRELIDELRVPDQAQVSPPVLVVRGSQAVLLLQLFLNHIVTWLVWVDVGREVVDLLQEFLADDRYS